MKKPYVKPQLYYENFELSQHVAACGWDMSNAKKKEDCSALGDTEWGNEPVVIFIEGNSNCVEKPEVYCYEASSNGVGLFNS